MGAEKVSSLQSRIAELEAEVERLGDALVNMEVAVIDGYFVRVWQQSGSWIAYCPTVGTVVELDSREAALAGIGEDMREMIAALVELGEPLPGKDVTCQDAQTAAPVR